jgi:hypothetical protein
MWTGLLYQFVLPPAEKGEAIIIIGIRRRTREIRESPLSSCQGLPHRVYVCDSSAGLLLVYAYTHVARAFCIFRIGLRCPHSAL